MLLFIDKHDIVGWAKTWEVVLEPKIFTPSCASGNRREGNLHQGPRIHPEIRMNTRSTIMGFQNDLAITSLLFNQEVVFYQEDARCLVNGVYHTRNMKIVADYKSTF